jgi:hypothetical protein
MKKVLLISTFLFLAACSPESEPAATEAAKEQEDTYNMVGIWESSSTAAYIVIEDDGQGTIDYNGAGSWCIFKGDAQLTTTGILKSIVISNLTSTNCAVVLSQIVLEGQFNGTTWQLNSSTTSGYQNFDFERL